MAGTPNVERVKRWVRQYWDVRFSMFNCRPKRSGTGWSQHAGSEWHDPGTKDYLKYKGNAVDIFGTRTQMDAIAEWLVLNAEALGVQQILYRGKSLLSGRPIAGHYDHIHCGMWPMMDENLDHKPPCKGGDLKVFYPRGTVPRSAGHFKLWPASSIVVPPDNPDSPEEDMEQMVKDIQANLNAAGFTDQNGQPLVVDGVWGAKTKYAHGAMCGAAGAVEQEVKKVIDVLNVVVEGDQLTLEITPPAGYSTADVVKVEK